MLVALTWLWMSLRLSAAPARVASAIASLGPDVLFIDLRDELRRRSGDKTLSLLIALPDGGWSDAQGSHVDLPNGRSSMVRSDFDGRPIVAVVAGARKSVVSLDPALSSSALAVQNHRLMSELGEQASGIADSLDRLAVLTKLEASWIRDLIASGPIGALDRIHDQLLAIVVHDVAVSDSVQRAARRVASAAQELRELVSADPDPLQDRGLAGALPRLREQHEAVHMDVRVQRLPAAVERLAYYLVTELVTNAVKYAAATRIVVDVSMDGKGILAITVEDDGVGGAVATPRGLGALEPVIRQRGGSLTLRSPLGGGTRVDARLIV